MTKFAISLAGLTLLACGQDTPGPTGELSIVVTPLTLPGIVEATYTLAVDAGEQRVWDKTITSTRYGDGAGAATYVGTCDASTNPNRVSLVLDSLVEAPARTLGVGDFVNPAPADRPIVIEKDCIENADVQVEFNIAVMRAAKQGFFDIAVNFDDIFCSAKVDCAYPSGPIELLHDPRTGERGPTMNVGFACTAGNDEPSWLYLSELVLDCGDETFRLDPSALAAGNQGPRLPALFQWGLYRGVEFTQAAVDFDKCFTNAAIGLDTDWLAGRTCTLRAIGTAASRYWQDGRIPAATVYPVVEIAVPVSAADGALVCAPAQHALDAAGSGVITRYLRPSEQADVAFGYALDCSDGEVTTPGGLTCNGGDGLRVRNVEGGVQLEAGAAISAVYTLPSTIEGRTVRGLGDTCCIDPCCE